MDRQCKRKRDRHRVKVLRVCQSSDGHCRSKQRNPHQPGSFDDVLSFFMRLSLQIYRTWWSWSWSGLRLTFFLLFQWLSNVCVQCVENDMFSPVWILNEIFSMCIAWEEFFFWLRNLKIYDIHHLTCDHIKTSFYFSFCINNFFLS